MTAMEEAQTGPAWRSVRGLCTAQTWMFGAIVVAAAITIGSLVRRLSVIDAIEGATATREQVRRADDLVSATVTTLFACIVVTGIVFIVWQWRCAKNAEAAGRTGTRFGPGWSIGGWFIPIANLVIPVLIMQDLWRSSSPKSNAGSSWRRQQGSALVGWWWAAFAGAGLVARSGGTECDASLEALRSCNRETITPMIVMIVAAVLAMFVVRAITDRQEVLRASTEGRSLRR